MKATFAYYNSPYGGLDNESASYLIENSDNPLLPHGANVGIETLLAYGLTIPAIPAYDEWVSAGSIKYRGNAAVIKL